MENASGTTVNGLSAYLTFFGEKSPISLLFLFLVILNAKNNCQCKINNQIISSSFKYHFIQNSNKACPIRMYCA